MKAFNKTELKSFNKSFSDLNGTKKLSADDNRSRTAKFTPMSVSAYDRRSSFTPKSISC